MRRLVIGCGYLGMHVARLWRDAGDEVYATTRGQRADVLTAAALQPITLDVTQGAPWPALPAVDTVLFAVGRPRHSGLSMSEIHVRGLRAVLDALPESTGRVIYVSSTSVYGHHAAEWVDESSACEPVTEGGRACLAAERLLFAHPRGSNAIALRLAGLYGAGRVPLAGRVAAGELIPGSPDAYLNLVHVDDAAAAVIVVAADGVPGNQTVIVSDGHPVVKGEYVAALAKRAGVAAPPFGGGHGLGKRVRNARVIDLGLRLKYPTYRDGLAVL